MVSETITFIPSPSLTEKAERTFSKERSVPVI